MRCIMLFRLLLPLALPKGDSLGAELDSASPERA